MKSFGINFGKRHLHEVLLQNPRFLSVKVDPRDVQRMTFGTGIPGAEGSYLENPQLTGRISQSCQKGMDPVNEDSARVSPSLHRLPGLAGKLVAFQPAISFNHGVNTVD